MDKIYLYVLVTVDTNHSFDATDVQIFPTFQEAQHVMQIDVLTRGKTDMPKGAAHFEDESVCVSTDYAYTKDGNRVYWDIFRAPVENILPALLSNRAFDGGVDFKYRDTVERLASEVKTNTNPFEAVELIWTENFIGETLYYNALERITSKTDEETTTAVHDALNNAPNHKMWLNRMIAVCDCDPDAIMAVRDDANSRLPYRNKLENCYKKITVLVPVNKVEELESIDGLEVLAEG